MFPTAFYGFSRFYSISIKTAVFFYVAGFGEIGEIGEIRVQRYAPDEATCMLLADSIHGQATGSLRMGCTNPVTVKIN